ncbi:Protein CBG26896 [Caenorhabditis briggsae]|uniref:Uncharacterized protein n=2 Tax=Caenorhabditis briggsae TaxID=6238 RepID=A0AAE9A0B6_CAEBR|nr:Protein CBG26896 [Caenorhabditis briggsae]ULT86142.1 hypothetical protein L3Y34_006082 [Caenorhabditis briggsae]CAR99626.1 Protein CBG26896 [Caenorhabditis briggsae]
MAETPSIPKLKQMFGKRHVEDFLKYSNDYNKPSTSDFKPKLSIETRSFPPIPKYMPYFLQPIKMLNEDNQAQPPNPPVAPAEAARVVQGEEQGGQPKNNDAPAQQAPEAQPANQPAPQVNTPNSRGAYFACWKKPPGPHISVQSATSVANSDATDQPAQQNAVMPQPQTQLNIFIRFLNLFRRNNQVNNQVGNAAPPVNQINQLAVPEQLYGDARNNEAADNNAQPEQNNENAQNAENAPVNPGLNLGPEQKGPGTPRPE